jgi:signal transduction histidine kinase
MKSHSKIALRLFISNLLIILLFGSAVYYFQNDYSYIDFYKRLETRAGIAAKYNFETDSLSAEAVKTIRDQHLEKLTEEKEYLFPAGDHQAMHVAAEKYGLPQELLEDVQEHDKATLKKGNTFYAGVRHRKENRDFIIVVSAENYYGSHHLSFLRNILLVGVFFSALLAVYLSVYFSKHVFAPIKQITDRVKQISTDSIHLRLEEAENNNEIAELTSTFNDLLNRIETAFETQKNFISNASHELGTPLTAIIGEADVALIKEREPGEYRDALQKISTQAERLDKITKSLLFLAQTGYKQVMKAKRSPSSRFAQMS